MRAEELKTTKVKPLLDLPDPRLIELIPIASLFLRVGINTRSEIYLQLTRNKVPR